MAKSVLGADQYRVDQVKYLDVEGRQHYGVLITLTNEALSVSMNILVHPENAKDFASLIEMTAHDIFERGDVPTRH